MARKMKDSGIEWIGEIPEGWEVVPVRSCFDEVRTKNTDGQEQNALQFKSGNIISKANFNTNIDDYVADTITNYTVVLPDTIMINGLNLNYDFKSLRVALVKEKGVITSAYLAIFPDREKIFPQYATYLFKGYETKMAFHNMGAGIRKTLGYKEFKNQPLLLPSEKEQNKISAYLDSKCSHIDIMLSKIRSSIEEYKKLKQAVITQAVTKGVRGKREMKDSGVEWIGEIPAEWSIAKAKYYVTITHGSDPKTEGSIPVYGSGAESFKTCGEYKEGPTVLIGRKGATLHIPHYIEGKYWNVDTAFDVKAKNNFSLPYYYYLATSFDYKFYIAQTTLPGMTQSNYYNMFLPLPTFPEQEEIVNYLDAKCAEIDGLIAKKEQLVRELESYKKSLIYEVVTGKREV
jgi:type I restriction enzyme S subunit